jgi:hypothetical protein
MEVLQHNLIPIAGGAGALLLLIIVMMIIRKRKKKKIMQTSEAEAKAVVAAEMHEEEFHESHVDTTSQKAEVNALEEVYTNVAHNFIAIKFKVAHGPVVLTKIEPNHNKYGAIHNYHALLNRSYGQNMEFKVFFDKGKFGIATHAYKFKLDFYYTDAQGRNWKQAFVFSKPGQAAVKSLRDAVAA